MLFLRQPAPILSSHYHGISALSTAVALLALVGVGGFTNARAAAMPSGTVLTIIPAEGTCLVGGTFPNCDFNAVNVTSGSFFQMGGVFAAQLFQEQGVILDTPQPAGTGSHGGAPLPGDTGAVTQPWLFFSNTGHDYTVGDGVNDNDDGTLDYVDWRVTWNGIPAINMGGDPAQGDTGFATIICTPAPCADGSSYVLDYLAHVPAGDPSGFGGTLYEQHLEGSISFPGTPPITLPDSGATIVGNPVTIAVLDNDSSADGLDPASVTIVVPGPANGSANPNADGSITYTSDTAPDFVGMDAFEYTVDSNLGTPSAPTMVDVDVQANVAPVANDDVESVSTAVLDNSGGSITIDVLANDTDANNTPGLPGGIDPSTVALVSDAVTGTCTANADGTITYTQSLPSVGATDTCTYMVSDADSFKSPLESNVASVDITVTATTSDWPAALDPDVIAVLHYEAGVPGDPVDTSVPAQSGSYFTMQVTPTTLIYTVLIPGPDDGVVVDHDQPAGSTHTGVPTGEEETGLDLAWSFFSNTGLHWTRNGGVSGKPDGTLDFNTKWLVSWNGIQNINLGGSSEFPEDLGFAPITCNPAPCTDGSSFELDYAAHVEDLPGEPASGFNKVPYTLHLEGTVGFLDGTMKTSTGVITRENRLTVDEVSADADVDLQCVGDCFEYTIEDMTANKGSIVIPLAGGVSVNPVWRIEENGVWRSFDTTVDIIKSAPLAAGDTECPGPGDAAYTAPLTTGHYCIELTIQDNGLNDLDPSVGTISDPGGMGAGGDAGGGSVFEDTRTSSTSESWGCSLMANDVNPLKRGDWWLLAGFIALLAWYRTQRGMQR